MSLCNYCSPILKELDMKKVILTLPLLATLTACGTPSVEELSTDQVLLEETIVKCQEMKADAMDSELCKNASEAAIIFATKSAKEAMDALSNG